MDPFKTNRNYQGKQGLESLFSRALPHILIRTDPSTACVCQNPMGKDGVPTCTRCFGTGKVIRSIDRVRAFVTDGTRAGFSPMTPMGWEESQGKKIFMGRWVYPQLGDIFLEVGWNLPPNQVIGKGYPRRVDNVYLVKSVLLKGFETVSYTELHGIFANIRKDYIQNILLNGRDLPPYRDSLAGDEN